MASACWLLHSETAEELAQRVQQIWKKNNLKGGFPLFAETTRSELASTRQLAEQFPVIGS